MVADASKAGQTRVGSRKKGKRVGLGKVAEDLKKAKGSLRAYRGVKYFGLLLVREARESGHVSKKHLDAEQVIAYGLLNSKQAKELGDVYQQIKDKARRFGLTLISQGRTDTAEIEYFGASVAVRWWLFTP
jgi:hypothetical protein